VATVDAVVEGAADCAGLAEAVSAEPMVDSTTVV
jgi:hypothetical protein